MTKSKYSKASHAEKLDIIRAMIKAKNIGTLEIADKIGVSKVSAQVYINELMACGEVLKVSDKKRQNAGLPGIYAHVDNVVAAADDARKPVHRFNPAQWCVSEDAGGVS